MLNAFAKLAIVGSLVVFSAFTIFDWIGYFFGWHDDIAAVIDLPSEITPSPGIVALGTVVAMVGLASLAVAYLAIWRILSEGVGQNFRALARRLQLMGGGLIVVWICSYLNYSVLRSIAIIESGSSDVEFILDPFHTELVLAIAGVALLAISRMMDRAWEAEDENRHFL